MALRKASEIREGDVLLDRYTRPLVVVADSTLTRYRGKQPGWRIRVEGYPAIVVPGDPLMPIADDPENAWNERAKLGK